MAAKQSKPKSPIRRAGSAIAKGNQKVGNAIWNDAKGVVGGAVDFARDAKGSLDYLGNGMINAGKWAVTAPKQKMGPPAPKGTPAARPQSLPRTSPGSSASRPQGYDPRGVPGSPVRMGAAPIRGGGHAPAAWTQAQIQDAYNARTQPKPIVAVPRAQPRYTPAAAAPANRAAQLRQQARVAMRTGDHQTAAAQLVQSYSPGTADFYGEALPAGMVQPPQWTNTPQLPAVDGVDAYRMWIQQRAAANDAAMSQKWLQPATPLAGNPTSQPRSMQEFMSALTPAQLASPEVQSLLETFLNDPYA